MPAALQQQYAQLFTARMLGAAVTPASVAAIRTASVEQDIVPQLQQLTSELSHLLSVHTGGEASDRLMEKVREHCRLMQLLQAAAQEKMWRLVSASHSYACIHCSSQHRSYCWPELPGTKYVVHMPARCLCCWRCHWMHQVFEAPPDLQNGMVILLEG